MARRRTPPRKYSKKMDWSDALFNTREEEARRIRAAAAARRRKKK